MPILTPLWGCPCNYLIFVQIHLIDVDMEPVTRVCLELKVALEIFELELFAGSYRALVKGEDGHPGLQVDLQHQKQ